MVWTCVQILVPVSSTNNVSEAFAPHDLVSRYHPAILCVLLITLEDLCL